MKSNAEKLIDLLAKLAESETVVTDGINDAYQLAGLLSCELDEEREKVDGLREELAGVKGRIADLEKRNSTQAETIAHYIDDEAKRAVTEPCCAVISQLQARIAELEQNGPVMQRGVNGAGTPLMGTMRQVLEDYKTAAATEAKLGDEARAECDQLRARVAELECQAAIGRRAVAVLQKLEWLEVRRDHERPPRVGHCVLCGYANPIGHKSDCELAAILRDAEQAGMGVGL